MKNRIKTNKANKANKINKIQIEVGLDEVGRGSLFGPLLVASFLIIKINDFNPYNTLKLKDSKKLTENQRITIFNEIINILRKYRNISKLNFYFISNELIDKINILNANLLGFEKLIIINLENILKNKEIIDNLDKIEYINFYLDGDKKPYNIESKIQEFLKTNFNYHELLKKINILNYVKGDSNIRVIQLAAISAKVTRDKYIQFLAQKFPQYNLYYNLYNNKGYYEEIHIKGIRDYGITKYHRKSFLKKYFQKTLF
jgi:ribonuclease HII